MKTSGVGCEPKFGLLVFLGHPSVYLWLFPILDTLANENYYNLLPCPCNLAFWICAWLAKRLHLIDEPCGFWHLQSESTKMAFKNWLWEIGKAFRILTNWFILITTQRVKMTLDMVDTGRGENCQCSRITIYHDIEVQHRPIAKH